MSSPTSTFGVLGGGASMTGPAAARRLVIVETASGDIARQLVWHTVGAHDFLARRTSAEPAS